MSTQLPISVALSIDSEPALYSGPGRDGLLRLGNDGESSISVPGRIGPPSATDHHLALHLPAGTLSPSSMADLRAAGPWTAAVVVDARHDGGNRWDAVYLSSQEAFQLLPGQVIVVELRGLAAQPGGRARTTRLVVDYDLDDPAASRQQAWAGAGQPVAGRGAVAGRPAPVPPARLAGSRSVSLHVVPWQHNPAHLHLMAGVRRGAEVLNQATVANDIEIRLAADVVLGAIELVGGQTELVLSWDVGPADDRWWALCSAAEANAAVVSLSWSFADERQVPDPILDEDVWVSPTAASWSLTVPSDVALRQGDHLAIVVSGLYTAHPSGPANLYLDVIGVGDGSGGAISGSFVLPVHKQAHRWSSPGGLLAVGSADAPLLDLRNEHAAPALLVSRAGSGYAVDLFVDDDRGREVTGARLSSDGDAFLGRGLHVRGPLEIGGDGGKRQDDRRRDDGAPWGRLRLEPPDGTDDYVLGVRRGALVAGGDLDVLGELTIGGGAPLAIRSYNVVTGEATVADMGSEWQALLVGSPSIPLRIGERTYSVLVGLQLDPDGWKLMTYPDALLRSDAPTILDEVVESTIATVLFVRNSILG